MKLCDCSFFNIDACLLTVNVLDSWLTVHQSTAWKHALLTYWWSYGN